MGPAVALTGIFLQLPLSQPRFSPLSLPATGCISIQLPSFRQRPSIRLGRHLLCPGHLSPRRPRPLSISLSAAAASAFSSASAAPPLASRSGHNNQPLAELLETDGGGGGGGSSGGGALGDHDGDSNRKAALKVPPRKWDDWALGNPLADSDGLRWFLVDKKSPLLGWLLRFGGIKERLLADDVFLAKVAIECGLGILSKNFFKEPETVLADMAMALMAEFMLVHLLPAPTASFTPTLLSRFFHGCPDNAFQIALSGSSYSLAQRLGAIAISGGKHLAVGMASSMWALHVRVRTVVRNALVDKRNVAVKSSGGEVENVPILSTSLAYGIYMAISDNLRSQVLDGVIEHRILEPVLHQHKFMLGAIRFAVQTGNTFLGSLLWIDYAHWVGIQK